LKRIPDAGTGTERKGKLDKNCQAVKKGAALFKKMASIKKL